jgi:hypothetical protein
LTPTIVRKVPSGSEEVKSFAILVDPRVNAALPAVWQLKVLTENDAQVPCSVVAGFQFIR